MPKRIPLSKKFKPKPVTKPKKKKSRSITLSDTTVSAGEVVGKVKKKVKVKKGTKKEFVPSTTLVKALTAKAEGLPTVSVGEPTEKELRKMERLKKKMAKFNGAFKSYVPEAQMLIDRKEIGNSTQLVQRAMLMTLLQAIPIAEASYRDKPGQSNAYALQAMINSAREVMAEIEAQDDGTNLSAALVQEILMPQFQEIGQQLVLALLDMKNALIDWVPRDSREQALKKFNDTSSEIRQLLGQRFNAIRTEITDRVHRQ